MCQSLKAGRRKQINSLGGIDITKEINDLFDIYMRCQVGEKDELNQIFCSDNNGGAIFRFDCLKKLVNRAKSTFVNEGKETKGKHRKYYTGSFDTSDIEEMTYLIVTEIFYAVPDDEKCISIENVKSVVPITDGKSLMQNISYFLDKLCNCRASITFKDISENTNNKDTGKEREIKLSDAILRPKKLIESHGEVSRNRKSMDVLHFLKKDIYVAFDLFNSDSCNVKAMIKTVLEKPETFFEYDGHYEMVQNKMLCEMVENYTGVHIWENNVSTCFGTIKERIFDYLYICPGQHKNIFCMDDSEVYHACAEFKGWKSFIEALCEHDEFIINWKKQFDLSNNQRNLLGGNIDLMDKSPGVVAAELAENIELQYRVKETRWILELMKEYHLENKLSDDKIKYWDANYNKLKQEIKLIFYSHENVKHPIEVKADLQDIIIYEGFTKYVVCDAESKVAYILLKDRRKKIKNRMKKIA